jgi:uncharacterized membrane protein YgcG
MRTLSRCSAILLMAAAFTAPLRASANCGRPVTYHVTVTGQNVNVCLWNFDDRMCPDQGLLRRNKSTNQVVMVTTCNGGCFEDDCVPPGDYQYGLLVPYSCVESSCYTAYFQDVTVSAPAQPATCTSVATPFTGTVPWGDEALICTQDPDGGTNPGAPDGGTSGGGGGGSTDGGSTDGGSTDGGSGSHHGGGRGSDPGDPIDKLPWGCGSEGSVLTVNGLVLMAGLLLWRARSRRSSPRA